MGLCVFGFVVPFGTTHFFYLGGENNMSLKTPFDMTGYLKQAMELEVSVYTQERAISNSKQLLKKKKPKYVEPKAETVEQRIIEKPSSPKEPVYETVDLEEAKRRDKSRLLFKLFCGLIIALVGIVILWCGIMDARNYAAKNYSMFQPILTIIISIIIFFISLGYIVKNLYHRNDYRRKAEFSEISNSSLKKRYEEALNKYEKELKQYNIDIAQAEQDYKTANAKAKKEYDSKKEKSKQKYNIALSNHSYATKKVNQLERTLTETKSTLDKLYALDVVYSKYRNLVAISTMYEYFASGRVSQLEGPNGAYNLYESELRQNLIINKLDTIITQLEDIKANQYALYTELQETNRTLRGISSDISAIVSNTNKIADNTRDISKSNRRIADNTDRIAEASNITAYCAQVTAKNTEALKYIALVN